MTDRGMALWTLALLLAACRLVPATANSVKFIEGPVLLRFNQSRTVVRCSIEVEGGVRPRIDFYIDGVPAHISPYLSCNSESVLRYELENGFVPRECEGSNEQTRIRHQALFISTCSSDPSSFNTTTIQCRVHSDKDPTVNGTASSRMNLSYNQRREPRLDPQPGELVKFLPGPVCPGEDLGKLSLESPPPTASSTSAVVVPSSSQFYAQPTATPSPSGLPPPPTMTNNPLDQLGEGQLKLIIYVATGVAAFFALLVVCLVFVLCCIVLKKHRILKAAPLRQGRREAVGM